MNFDFDSLESQLVHFDDFVVFDGETELAVAADAIVLAVVDFVSAAASEHGQLADDSHWPEDGLHQD
jgi:hypothetical protein